MTILQMHIEIQQRLRNVDAAVYGDLLEEEIDLAIDNAIMRVVDETIPQVEQDFSKIEVLRELHVKSMESLTFQTPETDILRCPLPFNLKHLLSSRSNIYTNACKPVIKTDVEKSVKIAVVPFKIAESTNDFQAFNISLGPANVVFNLIGNQFRNPENIQHLLNEILEKYKVQDPSTSKTIEVYWETYKGVHRREHLIFVTDSASTQTSMTLNFGPDDSKSATFETYTYVQETATGGSYIKVGNRTAHSDDVSDMLNDPFNTSKPHQPLTDIHSKYLDIYVSKMFSVDKVFFNYIRMPRPVSLRLNLECELSPAVHQKVVDYSVVILLERFKAERYQSMEREASKNL